MSLKGKIYVDEKTIEDVRAELEKMYKEKSTNFVFKAKKLGRRMKYDSHEIGRALSVLDVVEKYKDCNTIVWKTNFKD